MDRGRRCSGDLGVFCRMLPDEADRFRKSVKAIWSVKLRGIRVNRYNLSGYPRASIVAFVLRLDLFWLFKMREIGEEA